MVIITAASLPVTFSLLAVLLMMLASLAFLLSPAVLEFQVANRAPAPSPAESNGEVTTRWSDNVT